MKIYQKNSLGVTMFNCIYDALVFIYEASKIIIKVILIVYGLSFWCYLMFLMIVRHDLAALSKAVNWVSNSLHDFITNHSVYMTCFKIMAVFFVYAFLCSAVKRYITNKKA